MGRSNRSKTQTSVAGQTAVQDSRLLRCILDNATDGISVMELDPKTHRRRLMMCNDRLVEISGRSRRELMAGPLKDFVEPLSQPPDEQIMREYRRGQTVRWIHRWLRPDGKDNYHEHAASVVERRNGKWIIVGIDHDVTDRLKVEDEAWNRDDLFRKIMASSSDGINIVEVDPETRTRRLIFCNDRYVQMSGFSREQLMAAENLNKLGTNVYTRSTDQLSKIERGVPNQGLASWKRPDGKENVYEFRATLIGRKGKKLIVMGIDRDITERKRIEELLHLQNQIAQNMSEGVNMVRASDGVIVYTNPRMDELFGYDPDELSGKHVSVLNAPGQKSPEQVADEIMSGLRRDGVWRGEIHNIKKDGTTFWSQANVSEFGHPEYGQVWLAVQQDITDRKLAHQRLDESHQLLEKTFASLRDAVLIVNSETKAILDCNPAACEMFGHARDQMIGRNTESLHADAESLAQFRQDLYQAVERDGYLADYESQMRRKDGSIFPSLHSVTPLFDEQGRRSGWISVVRDLTEHKQAQEELARATTLFEQLLKHTTDGICLTEMDPKTLARRILTCNDRFVAMSGRSRRELLEAEDIRVFFATDVGSRIVRQKLTEDHPGAGMASWLRPDGKENYHEYVAALVGKSGSNWLVMTIDRDITEARKAREALEESERRFRLIAENVQDVFWLLEPNAEKVVYISPAFRTIMGIPVDEALQSPRILMDRVHPEDLPQVQAAMKGLVRGRDLDSEYRIFRRDGALRWIRNMGFPVRDETGKILYLAGVARDITSRKQTEQALRERNELFDKILKYSTDGINITWKNIKTGRRRLVLCNDRFVEMSGFSREQLMATDDMRDLTEVVQVSTDEYIVAKLRDGAPSHGVSSWKRPDGRENYYEYTGSLLEAHGDELLILGIDRDITEQKKTRDELRSRNELFDKILNYSTDGINIACKNARTGARRLVLANDRFVEMTGRSREQLMACEDLRRFVQPVQAPPDEDIIRRLRNGSAFRGVSSWKRPDGRENYYEYTGSLIEANGDDLLVLGIDRDITEQKKARDELRSRNELFDKILKYSTDGINIAWKNAKTGARRMVLCNDRFVQMSGRTRQELMKAKDISKWLVSRKVTPERKITQDLRKGMQATGIGSWKRPDGKENYYEYTGSLIEADGDELLILGIDRDITERVKMEQKFRQAAKMEAVGKLAGGVAHDFNNQLTVIKGYCDLLLKSNDLHGGARESITEVLNAAGRGQTLTSQLLAFSRRLVLRPEVLNMNTVLNGLAGPLGHMISEDISICLVLGEHLSNVRADPAQLEQAVMNLVVNASDAMPAGGTLTIQTTDVKLDEDYIARNPDASAGPHVMLAVTDTGVGMDAETMTQIFEPFFTTKAVGEGTGLGLSMVYGFVRQSGGHVAVESEPGRGATFRIYLPRVDEPITFQVEAFSVRRNLKGTETVLVVEDEDSVRQFLIRVLGKLGYTVLHAADARRAMTLTKKHKGKIDLLVADVVMPKMSGPQLYTKLRKGSVDMKVLYISGYAEQTVLTKKKLRVNADLLSKPFSPQELAGRVRDALDRK